MLYPTTTIWHIGHAGATIGKWAHLTFGKWGGSILSTNWSIEAQDGGEQQEKGRRIHWPRSKQSSASGRIVCSLTCFCKKKIEWHIMNIHIYYVSCVNCITIGYQKWEFFVRSMGKTLWEGMGNNECIRSP